MNMPEPTAFFCSLDRPSLVLWCSCGFDFNNIKQIDTHTDHIKVWFNDGRMANLMLEK